MSFDASLSLSSLLGYILYSNFDNPQQLCNKQLQ